MISEWTRKARVYKPNETLHSNSLKEIVLRENISGTPSCKH